MARSTKRARKPTPVTGTVPAPVIEVAPYRDQINDAARAAAMPATRFPSVERALDLYIRGRLSPPVTLADKRAHMQAVVKHAGALFRLLSAVRNLDAHRDFRDDLGATKTKSVFYMKLFGDPNTPLEPSILAEMNTTRDQLRHLLESSRWLVGKLKKRPASPAQVLATKLARLVPGDAELRTLLVGLNHVLETIRADFQTDDLRISDPARLVRERKK